ncbi:MAG: NADH-quinone oxidoreductase subunit J [Calditrichaeota bacterium]|nr:NADH-quinone oxidoreductase subunit J [Calditrichota bacterium]
MRYFSVVLFVALFVQLGYFGYQGFFGAENVPLVRETEIGTVEQIGTALFSQYVLPFEIASILLLTAMIGALYLSKQKLGLGEPARAARVKEALHEKEEAH